jgi:opacity protein-like surface antigen
MSINHISAALFSILLAIPVATSAQGLLRLATSGLGIGPVAGATPGAEPDLSGFYGGIARRDHGTDAGALSLGPVPSAAWSRYTAPAGDDATRSLFWGGYRWRNDLAVEAAFSSRDQYALKPDRSLPPGRGVGLQLASDAGPLGETTSRAWNVDVFTSWSFYRSFALYGRMGYAQSETTVLYGPLPAADGRRTRDGMNYGVGMRYDMNSALGLRLEYGRFGRFSTEFTGGLPETDQVTLGVQLRF